MTGEIFTALPDATTEEQLQILCQTRNFRIERIVSKGQASPPDFWYDQEGDEWALLLSGTATLKLKDPDETIFLATGDWIFLPAHRRHRVQSTSREPAAIWLAVHGQAPV